MIPINSSGLYFHIPFCRSKCSYCDYYSLSGRIDRREIFLEMLIEEMRMRAEKAYSGFEKESTFSTAYLGGGTPSLLEPQMVAEIIKEAGKNFNLVETPEITMEVNPADLQTEKKLRSWQDAGVNRFSLGLQSLRPEELDILNRGHDRSMALEALRLMSEEADNFSADLIYALPNQRPEEFFASLDELLSFNPHHLSVYRLEIKKGTDLKEEVEEGLYEFMDEEREARIFSDLDEIASAGGLKRYEIASYARSGYRSQHNLHYWRYNDYLGFGPAAHGLWQGRRIKNLPSLSRYIDSISRGELPPGEVEMLELEDRISEFMIMGLRLCRGIEEERFQSRFGRRPEYYFSGIIDELRKEGLLARDGGRIFLTERGMKLGNYVFRQFLL